MPVHFSPQAAQLALAAQPNECAKAQFDGLSFRLRARRAESIAHEPVVNEDAGAHLCLLYIYGDDQEDRILRVPGREFPHHEFLTLLDRQIGIDMRVGG